MHDLSVEHPSTIEQAALTCRCNSCALYELCLPAHIAPDDLRRLDATIRDKRTLDPGAPLYRDGDAFRALFVVRSGSFKTFMEDGDGTLQVLGFHLPGEIVGLDGLADEHHVSHAVALERASVCELPYRHLERVATEIPSLQRQLMRVISRERIEAHHHLAIMGRPSAQERLAIFLRTLAACHARLRRDPDELHLSMSRQDIASYLGLAMETVSRLFARMEQAGVLAVRRRAIRILRPDLLEALSSRSESGAESTPPSKPGQRLPQRSARTGSRSLPGAP